MSSQLQVSGEAKIRDIQGPVVANSGVITALDGAASQYVRGDGTLADFPTSSGGGSSVSYYLNSSVSQGTIGGVAYRELNKEPIIGAGTDIAIAANGYVASYLTDANDPDVLSIPGGNFNCEFYFSVSNDTGNPFFYAELYKYDGTTFTLLGSSVGVPEYINQGTIIAPYYFAIPVPTSALALTDRLAIRIYVNVDGRTVTLHTENSHLCQVVTTLSKGMVSLNSLTDQSQFITTGTSGTDFNIVSTGDTHTFNLPIASATNTGKLSSTDWTTFNNKQNALTNPVTGTGTSGQVAYFNGTSSITSNAAFAFTPTSQLLVNNSVTAASAIARGTNLTPTLTAVANNDVLVGLDINPTFNTGAFTNVGFYALRVNGVVSLYDSAGATQIRIIGPSNSNKSLFFGNSSAFSAFQNVRLYNQATTNLFVIATGDGTANPTDRFFITQGGNVGINTSGTDAGFRLDVNGTARVQGQLTVSSGNSLRLFDATNTNAGTVSLGSTTQSGASIVNAWNGSNVFSWNNNGLNLIHAATGNNVIVFNRTALSSGTTSAAGLQFTSGGSFAPTTGTNEFQVIRVDTIYNATGGTNTIRGLFYNPTLTSLTGTNHIAIQTVSGDVLLGTTSGNVAIGTSTLATATEFTLGGSQTASSAIARGGLINTTLVAAANNDVLVGLDINPTFTNGAFTGVTNLALRVTGAATISSSLTADSLLVNRTASRNMLGISSIALPTSGAEEAVAVIKTNSTLWQLSTVGYDANSKGVRFYNNGGAGNTALEVTQIGGTRFIIDGGGLSAFSNSLAIGFGTATTAPTNGLAVSSTITIGGTSASGTQKLTVISGSGVIAGFSNSSNADFGIDLTSGVSLLRTSTGAISLGATSTEGLRMFASTRNVVIQNGGTFTDAGFRLDVNGTARVQTQFTVGTYMGNGGTIASSVGFYGAYSSSNNNVDQFLSQYTLQSTNVSNVASFRSNISTPASSFTLTTLYHFGAGFGTLGAGSAITNHYGYWANSNLSNANATNTYGFFGDIATGTGRWNLYMGGTANNYMAGKLLIGSTTDVASASVAITSTTQGFLPPRMTAAQRAAISSPATGLMVYQTDGTEGVYVYSGGTWKSLTMT